MNTNIIIGTDSAGKPFTYDIKQMPHLLISGNTGSGKSQFLHNLIFQLMDQNTSEEIKFIMGDCNRVEFVQYADIPYLYAPILTQETVGPDLFEWLDYEEDRRYGEFIKHRIAGLGGLERVNEMSNKVVMPRIVVIINELAHIINHDPVKVEKGIVRIAQLAKYSGIHMILSSYTASKYIFTGLMQANIPCKIAFRTNNEQDSKQILFHAGAEKLKGNGDMLFVPPDVSKPIRLQGGYIPDSEIVKRLEKYKDQKPVYNDVLMYAIRKRGEEISDDQYKQAIELVKANGKASTAAIQRNLQVGYVKAARILDKLEEDKIIAPFNGHSPQREVLQ